MSLLDSRLKILHILDHSLPLHSGYTFRSHNIFRFQRKRGWQPVVLTSPKHEESWRGRRTEKDEIEGICYYRSGEAAHGNLPIEPELRLMKVLSRRIHEVVDKEKPDIIHAHSPVLNAIPALRVGRKAGIPVVYEIRAFWEDAAVDHGTYKEGSWKYRLTKFIETWVCRKADEVAVLCKGLESDLLKRGISSNKLYIVPNGININDFQACEPDPEYKNSWKTEGKKIIGFIGSFYRYEGIDLLVKAFSRLAKTRSDVALLLVGGGEMESEIHRLINKLEIKDKIILPGRIPHDRIPGVYALIDILAYPRYSMRLTELVTPLKPIEAMAMGKVLVASDIGGHRELIQDGQTGILFPANDVIALTSALKNLLENKELRQTLSMHGNSWVRQERSWEKTTAVYSDIYKKVLTGHGAENGKK